MQRSRRHMIDVLFVIALFCVFAVTSLLVVLFGADVYKGIGEDMADNYNIRTSLNFLTEKIRQHDGTGDIILTKFGGEDALLFEREMSDGRIRQNWIFISNNTLQEMSAIKGLDVGGWVGTPIMEIKGLSLVLKEHNILEISITTLDGEVLAAPILLKARNVREDSQ
ncbi:DUF4860 domain-containing protein [Eubacteriales bacterium OttesenSCG-928-M02]|nr:DUF4860 domain-containing protein [Eubacteriales bacterium OttesenSCG-928-M02]